MLCTSENWGCSHNSVISVCKLHFYKILILIVFALMIAQYGLNVFFYQSSNYVFFNTSFLTGVYRTFSANHGSMKTEQFKGLPATVNFTFNSTGTSAYTHSVEQNIKTSKYRVNSTVSINGMNVTVHPSLITTNISTTRSWNANDTQFVTLVQAKQNTTMAINSSTSRNASSLPLCPLIPPKLVGPVKVWTHAPPFEELEKLYPDVQLGGRFQPKDCKSRHKVAIIIPYRDREMHLRMFLHNMHPILQRQQLDYGIYVIEQSPKTRFNRAMLMNVGYVESLKQYDYQCFIFHDVDLLPEDDRNLYSCPEQPRHMSVAVDIFNYKLPYNTIFGGVSALSKQHMEAVNGFSNMFWGWGGEDDDMSNRVIYAGLHISRYPTNIARYKMIKHNKSAPNPDRYNVLYKGKQRYKKDGISNLKYKRLDVLFKRLYTWVYVELQK